MWELANRTPYAADKSWTRDKNGAHQWLVAVKATFDIAENGALKLADEPSLPLLAPEFWGDPGTTSLRYEAEVVPPKPTTDVLVEGSAYAPSGRPAAAVTVTVRVAEVDKSIVVHGSRFYFVDVLGGLATTPGVPFEARTIRYEDAFGGADLLDPDPRRQRYYARNPVGRGVTADPLRLAQTPAHNIEYAGHGPRDRSPAGLGPIASFWSPRRERGGTYDEAWDRKKKPLLPDDYSDLTLLCAPDDQRPRQHLRGGESVLLGNLTPRGRLQFTLPKLYFAFTTYFGERAEEHRARLGAVLIEPDAMKLKLVWNTALPVRSLDVDYLDYTVIEEKAYLT